MRAPDVNVLVYAHRPGEVGHEAYRTWLEDALSADEPVGLSVLALTGFVRIVTNRRIFREPTPLPTALAAIDQMLAMPSARILAPGETHWDRVAALCRATGATGKLVSDAQHAAVAIEHGCTWVSRDGDFAKFEPSGLRFEHLVLD